MPRLRRLTRAESRMFFLLRMRLDACNAHIVHGLDRAAERRGGYRGFFGDRNIGRTGG